MSKANDNVSYPNLVLVYEREQDNEVLSVH